MLCVVTCRSPPSHNDDLSLSLHQTQQTLGEKFLTVSLFLKEPNTSSEASLFVWHC